MKEVFKAARFLQTLPHIMIFVAIFFCTFFFVPHKLSAPMVMVRTP